MACLAKISKSNCIYIGIYSNDFTKPTKYNFLSKLKCCGVKGPADWTEASRDIPGGCCKKKMTETFTAPADKIHDKGCKPALLDYLVEQFKFVEIAMIVIGSIKVRQNCKRQFL